MSLSSGCMGTKTSLTWLPQCFWKSKESLRPIETKKFPRIGYLPWLDPLFLLGPSWAKRLPSLVYLLWASLLCQFYVSSPVVCGWTRIVSCLQKQRDVHNGLPDTAELLLMVLPVYLSSSCKKSRDLGSSRNESFFSKRFTFGGDPYWSPLPKSVGFSWCQILFPLEVEGLTCIVFRTGSWVTPGLVSLLLLNEEIQDIMLLCSLYFKALKQLTFFLLPLLFSL